MIRFEIEEVRFHWGENTWSGAEHILGGVSYPGEIQFIGWDSKYNSYEHALMYPGAIAIYSFFLEVGENDNPNLDFLLHELYAVNGTASKHVVYGSLYSLFPTNLPVHNCEFLLYEGSLTTPPCTEGVLWHVFVIPTPLSVRQLRHFQSLVGFNGQKLSGNRRPVQPINNRKVWQHRELPMPAGTVLAAPEGAPESGFKYFQPYLGPVPKTSGEYGR